MKFRDNLAVIREAARYLTHEPPDDDMERRLNETAKALMAAADNLEILFEVLARNQTA